MERRPGPFIRVQQKPEGGYNFPTPETRKPVEADKALIDVIMLAQFEHAAADKRASLTDDISRYARSPELTDRLEAAERFMGPGLRNLHTNFNLIGINKAANNLINLEDSNPITVREGRQRLVERYVYQLLTREGYIGETEEVHERVLARHLQNLQREEQSHLTENITIPDLLAMMISEEKKHIPRISVKKTADNWFRATEKLANTKGPQAVLVLDYHDRTFMLDPGVTEFELDVKPRFSPQNEGGNKVSFVITGPKEKKPDEPDPETQKKITTILHQDWSEPLQLEGQSQTDLSAVPVEETQVVVDPEMSAGYAHNWVEVLEDVNVPQYHRVVIVGDDAVKEFYRQVANLDYCNPFTGKEPVMTDGFVGAIRTHDLSFSDEADPLPVPDRWQERVDELEKQELDRLQHSLGMQAYEYTVKRFLSGDPNRKFTYTIDHPDAMRPLQQITPGTIRHEDIRKELISRFLKRMSPIFAAKQYDTETINRVWNQFLRDAIDSETRKDEFFDPSNTRTPELVYRLFRAYTAHDEKDPEWMYAKSLDGLDVTVETGRSARRKKRPKHLKSELIYIGVSQQYSDEATE